VQSSQRTKDQREKLLFALLVFGCVCSVGWLIAAIVGWVKFAEGQNGVILKVLSPTALDSPRATFAVVTLGTEGGPYEDHVSGYLLRVLHEVNSKPWVALDGGAALGGVRTAVKNGVFADVQIPAADQWMPLDRYVMQKLVSHHLIGHTHLDHLLGVVTSTAETTFQGSNHTLWGLDFVVSGLASSVFNNVLWPALNTFPGSGLFLGRLSPLTPLNLEGSGLEVTAFPLAHGDLNSTAFLLSTSSNSELLYMSDVMPDACHWNARNQTCDVVPINKALWTTLAPLVVRGSLKAILIEASYPSSRPDNQLFGHLTPCYVVQELRMLASLACGTPASCLRGITVFITHIKGWWPSKTAATEGETPRVVIEKELKSSDVLHGTPAPGKLTSGCTPQQNDLGVDFVFVDRGFQYNV
jgi:3',5'-cyclic-nucleotide phosphodiesterase